MLSRLIRRVRPNLAPSGLPLVLAATVIGGGWRVDAGHPRPHSKKVARAPKKPARPKGRPTKVHQAGPVARPAEAFRAEGPAGQIVAMTNQARAAQGLAPLAVDPRLTEAAQIQAEAMAATGTMAHVLPGMPFPALQDRLHVVGFPYGWAGENLGMDAADAQTVESLWLASPEHRQNIFLPYFTATGVGVAYGPNGEPFYSQVFASQL